MEKSVKLSAPIFSHEEVRRNFFKSFLLIGILMIIIMALSYLIGYLLEDIRSGLLIGGVVCIVVIPLQLMTSRMVIMFMTRGKKLDLNDPKQRLFLSKVEGLSLAAGLKKVPEAYLFPSKLPNAFAGGMTEKGAFVAVTAGLLELLDEQELEGVVAHEISHIVHRDVMVSQLVVALVSVILVLAVILERIGIISAMGGGGRRRSSNNNNAGGAALVILAVMILALLMRPIAMLIGGLIQMAISRTREYAADAYAVRLCGYNGGLIGALQKLKRPRPYTAEEAESLGGRQLSTMYFYFGESSELFSTHPSLDKRIEKLSNMY